MADGQITADDVLKVLDELQDPESGRGLTKMQQVSDVTLADDRLSLTLSLTTFSAPLWEQTKQKAVDLLRCRFTQLKEVQINLAVLDRPPEKIGEIGLTAKSVIAVGSGKGGVGKSTIAACTALGLARAGCSVGLLDADVYGPSIPHLLGATEKPVVDPGSERIVPIEAGGVKIMSMGLLIPPDEAVIWRGPMLHRWITQFLRDTAWGNLDYLIIDMPPGTGDVALTLSQLLPLTGAVIVCTPQDVALLDAVKAIAMFRKVNIPLLGMVENMSYFVCPDCDKRHDIFGHGGAKARSAELDVPFLGEAPINIQVRKHGDEGRSAANFDESDVAAPFEAICQRLVENMAASRLDAPPLPTLSVLG